MAAADQSARLEASLPLKGTMIDHIIMNPVLLAKLRGVSLGASHAGVCNYHLSITARIALRRAPPTVYSTGRSRDYRRVKPQMVQKGKDIVEVSARTYATEAMDAALDDHRASTAGLPPFERLAALAQLCQDIYDTTLPKPPKGAAEIPIRITRYEHMRRVVDRWTQATTVARARLVSYGEAHTRYMDFTHFYPGGQGPSRAGSKRATAAGVEPHGPTLTRDTSAYMRTHPQLYDQLFKGKKMACMAAEIRQLWHAPNSPNDTPLERAAQELQVCRKLRAYHELILNRETARLTSLTRGMQLRVAIRTTSNFVAAAWATISNIRTGPSRGPDAPLAYIRSSADPNTLIPYGPLYEQEVVKQVGEKWGHKHISNSAIEYVLDLIDYGARSLPSASDPAAWIATEYTLSNFRRQLRRVRPNLAQGYEGPHLYPLAQMGNRVAIGYCVRPSPT